MISKLLKPISLLAFLAFASIVTANDFNNPYQGNVAVSAFDENELENMALKQVLVKVSGNADIAALEETKSLLKKSQQLLSRFGYQTLQGTKYYSAIFDKRKINQSLKDMQQPVWGETRPTTLIWLIKNNQLVSEQAIQVDTNVLLSDTIQDIERARGIKVQFPLMDLDDNLALSVADVRGRFYDQVASASSRYARIHFVVAELNALQGDKWKLNWQLVQSDTDSKQHRILVNEQFVGIESLVMDKMMNALATYYASKYAVLVNQDGKFTQTLHIKGINSLDKLTKLNELLEGLLAISSFKIVAAAGTEVNVDVKIKGGLESFKNTLLAQPRLQHIDNWNSNSATEVEKEPTGEIVLDEDKVDVEETEALYFNWR